MFNQCNFIGRLGQAPEQRFTASGTPVTNFSIATSEKYKDQNGQVQEKTEWIDVVAWKQLAEICAQYLEKGKLVFVSGKLQTRKWQDKNGQDRYSTEIIAQTMKMLDSPGQSSGQNAGQPQQQSGPAGYGQQNSPAGYGQPQNNGQPGGVPAFNPDDSIPF